jgi:hypothetical protein
MVTEAERAAVHLLVEAAMMEKAKSADQGPRDDSHDDDSTHVAERPTLASWNYECLLAHQQVHGQTEFLAKPRSEWLKPVEVPPEAEAEYWHRYQLFHTIPSTIERPKDETNTFVGGGRVSKAPTLEPTLNASPVYGSLTDIMNRSVTPSPACVAP